MDAIELRNELQNFTGTETWWRHNLNRELNMDRYLCNGAEDEECYCLGALVDEEGDEDYERSRYHAGPGAKAYLGKAK